MGIISNFRNRINENRSSEEVYIIAGLGNPGDKYVNTRHNVGFCTVDFMEDIYKIPVNSRKFKAFTGNGRINGKKVILLKPQTFMNLSGESIREALNFYKVDPKTHLIVIYDDVSLPVGQLRIRPNGSAGGHNGIKSIISNLGNSQEFLRIKVGVGNKPEGYDLADYVLGHFDKADRPIMQETCKKACEAVSELISGDVDKAMSKYNRKN